MNPPPNTVAELSAESRTTAPAALPATRLLHWSIRREIWENRSIYVAPLVVAGIILFGFLISTFRLPDTIRTLAALDAVKARTAVMTPYSMAASMILFTGIVAGFFYCLDALGSERRDRSILFWKSLPVSDRMTVLAKAGIPMAVIPLFAMSVALVTQLIMLLVSTVVLLVNGINPAAMWSRLSLFQMTLVMIYGVTAHALWYAPIYGWLLLVSAWARRATILWAALPFVALILVERLALGTSRFGSMLTYRFAGAMKEGFEPDAGQVLTLLSHLQPLNFLATPGLWAGLVFAAVCLALAVRLRRNRETN